jgi:glycerate kinase
MRILLATDKFKGSLSAAEVVQALSAGLLSADPGLEIDSRAVADGGDGTLDAALAAGFSRVEVHAADPLGRPRPTAYGRSGDTAVVELAGVCGLTLLGADLDPLGATSFGLGTVLAAVLDADFDGDPTKRIVLGIGGSASTDGGAGLLAALGARLLDAAGNPIGAGGGALAHLVSIDLGSLHPRLAEVELVVACDVDNPLCGPNGAAAIYGPQKGATTPELIATLDANLQHLADVVAATTGRDLATTPGAGAAGGVGFGALLLGAKLRSGIELMLELVGFEQALAGADLVITGEGSLDEQTLAGKAPAGVAAAARARGVPVVAVAGRSNLRADQLAAAGIDAVYPLSALQPDPSRSMADAAALLRRLGEQIGRQYSADRVTGAQP